MSIADFKDKLQDLPTLPAVAQQLNRESERDTFTAHSLAELISKDPPLAAKVLKLSNSAYYGLAKQVTTIDRAVTLLGISTIRNLALSISIFKLISRCKSAGLDIKGLWHHCLGVAVAAKILAAVRYPGQAEEAFLNGILHDIGAFAIIVLFPDQVTKVLELMIGSKLPQGEAEKKVLGFSHMEAGAIMAESWNFPEKHFRGIRFHHNPFVPSIDPADPDNRLLFAVYTANQMAKVMSLGTSFDAQATGIKPAAWEVLGISSGSLLILRNQIKNDFANILDAWQLDAD
jgi:putative nucleotidyltransferase with HDIG domain